MEIKYRQLRVSDLRATYEIRFSVYENLIREEHVRYIQREAALADISQGGGWICVVKGIEIGFCLPIFIPEPYLAALFVVPEFQGRGIGTELLRRALTWFEGKGASQACLVTDANSAAENFYLHRGWRQEGIADIHTQNKYCIDLK